MAVERLTGAEIGGLGISTRSTAAAGTSKVFFNPLRVIIQLIILQKAINTKVIAIFTDFMNISG